MCGIVGIFDTRGASPISERLLVNMRDRLIHRGPDGAGCHFAPGIGLAHRRLSIIDLATGVQPMANEDGSVVVVFNGEIYNFQPLAEELERLGHVFRSRCDTEVIIHGWEEWGAACVERFSGMFAFALWDSDQETLCLARDRFGKKPLYTSLLPDGRLLFASELKALLACPELRRDIDPQAVEEYLALGYVPDPRSIYSGTEKLPPGHRLVWRRGEAARLDRYWRMALDDQPVAAEQAVAEIGNRLRTAVEARLISDVPLGAFLSGGVDSSAVVANMAALGNVPVNTFCISFDERGFDESLYADQVARLYGTRHEVRSLTSDDFSLLDQMAGIFDEPFGDSSALPTYSVCALARERVTVALSGDGGDEILGGYRRYRWHLAEERVRRSVPSPFRQAVFGGLGRLYPKLDWAPQALRAKTTFQELSQSPEDAFFHSVCRINDGLRAKLYSRSFRAVLGGYSAVEVIRRHWSDADTEDTLRKAQYTDIMTWLPGDILTKVDRTSMAVSLETRSPFLDHQLAEWCVGLPVSCKIRKGLGKWVLKKGLEQLLPADLLYRPKKGFSSPLAAWFRGALVGHMEVAAERLGDSGIFDASQVEAMLLRHRRGICDHGQELWSLLMMDVFLAHHGGL